jgi:hypothetical protein
MLEPSAVMVAALGAACGFAIGALVPIANGQFVQALPNAYRARAFGVVQGGLQVLQGIAVVTTGALSQQFSVPRVVGLWSAAGALLMLVLVLRWPAPAVFAQARQLASATNGGAAPIPAQLPPPAAPGLLPDETGPAPVGTVTGTIGGAVAGTDGAAVDGAAVAATAHRSAATSTPGTMEA